MNVLSFLAFFSILAAHAGAQVPATADEIRDIKLQISKAERMDSVVNPAKIALDQAVALKRPAGEVSKLKNAYRRAKDDQDAAFTVAIHMTIAAYELQSSMDGRPSVMSSAKGRNPVWLPVAREPEERALRDAEGNITEHMPLPEVSGADVYGVTYSDGVTYIPRAVFRRGTAYLASTLLHERKHFEMYATPGQGDALDFFELELEARRIEKESLDIFFDPVKDAEARLEIEDNYIRLKNALDLRAQSRRTPLGWISGVLNADDRIAAMGLRHSPESLEDLEKLVVEAKSSFLGVREKSRIDMNPGNSVATQAYAPLVPLAQPIRLPAEVETTLADVRRDFNILRRIVADACTSGYMPQQAAYEFGDTWMKASFAYQSAKAKTGLELPLKIEDLYAGLKGCQFDLMKAFLEKPLWMLMTPAEANWGIETARTTYAKYNAAPTEDPAPARQRPSEDRSSGGVNYRYGPARRQLDRGGF